MPNKRRVYMRQGIVPTPRIVDRIFSTMVDLDREGVLPFEGEGSYALRFQEAYRHRHAPLIYACRTAQARADRSGATGATAAIALAEVMALPILRVELSGTQWVPNRRRIVDWAVGLGMTEVHAGHGIQLAKNWHYGGRNQLSARLAQVYRLPLGHVWFPDGWGSEMWLHHAENVHTLEVSE